VRKDFLVRTEQYCILLCKVEMHLRLLMHPHTGCLVHGLVREYKIAEGCAST